MTWGNTFSPPRARIAFVAAISLKLPEDLKRRIERLASAARLTPHAFMVAVLAREAQRGELRERFATRAAESEREAMASGKAYGVSKTFGYLAARVAGKKVRRPRTRAWRATNKGIEQGDAFQARRK
jgi:predicted transcriptional regulator